MSKPTGKIIAGIKFSSEINDLIKSTLDRQMSIAQNKWNLTLTTEEKDLVCTNALLQLCEKIQEVTKQPFPQTLDKNALYTSKQICIKGYEKEIDNSLYDNTILVVDFSVIPVLIKSKFHTKEVGIEIEHNKEMDLSILVERKSHGYIVAEESSDNSIWIGELAEEMHNYLIKWSKTAIFYGVGSFK